MRLTEMNRFELEAHIRALESERTVLKERIETLDGRIESLERELAEAKKGMVYMVTRYVRCGFDWTRQNVGAFSTQERAVSYCIENDPSYAATTQENPKTLDVLEYEVDALVP